MVVSFLVNSSLNTLKIVLLLNMCFLNVFDNTVLSDSRDYVVIGGTVQPGNEDPNVSLRDRERIMKNAMKLVPSLKVFVIQFSIFKLSKSMKILTFFHNFHIFV